MNEIEEAIRNLSPELKEKHKKALAEGYKNEICPECKTVLLAHHHFLMCAKVREGKCPMVSKSNPKSLLEQILPDDIDEEEE